MISQLPRWFLMAAVLTLLFLGSTTGSQPGKGDKGKGPAKAQPRKADFTLTAEELTREFLKDSKAADKKYKGKVVAVTGEVAQVYSHEGGKIAGITLKGAEKDKRSAASFVSFVPLPAFNETAYQLSYKQKVKLTGEYVEYDKTLGSVWVVKGSVEQLSKSEMVSVSAADLAREVDKDAKAADAKYAGKHLIVSGVIEDLVRNPKEAIADAQLKGDGKRKITVFIGAQNFNYLRKGQTVRLRGWWVQWARQRAPDTLIELYGGFIVEAK